MKLLVMLPPTYCPYGLKIKEKKTRQNQRKARQLVNDK
jgi:hypothetical protein